MISSQLAGILGKEKKEVNRNIRDMFQDKIDGGIISPLVDSRGYVEEYYLPEKESKMFVAKYDIDYLETVIEYWIDRNAKPLMPTQITQSMPELQIAEFTAKMLRMSDTSTLRMIGVICEDKGISTRFLPSYADETATKALGDLLKESGVALSAIAVNKILLKMGVLEEIERRAAKGGKKKFKSLTEYGKTFGKNETSKQNPNETQPRYYIDKFPAFMEMFNEQIKVAA